MAAPPGEPAVSRCAATAVGLVGRSRPVHSIGDPQRVIDVLAQNPGVLPVTHRVRMERSIRRRDLIRRVDKITIDILPDDAVEPRLLLATRLMPHKFIGNSNKMHTLIARYITDSRIQLNRSIPQELSLVIRDFHPRPKDRSQDFPTEIEPRVDRIADTNCSEHGIQAQSLTGWPRASRDQLRIPQNENSRLGRGRLQTVDNLTEFDPELINRYLQTIQIATAELEAIVDPITEPQVVTADRDGDHVDVLL